MQPGQTMELYQQSDKTSHTLELFFKKKSFFAVDILFR